MKGFSRIGKLPASLFLAGALAGAAPLSARGGEVPPGPAAGAPRSVKELLERFEEPTAGEEPMPPEVRANFIDKVRIAEEREQRIVGLREQGNPHFHPGVLLEGAAPDPERSRVDTDALRERLIRAVERRDEVARPGGGSAESPGGPSGGAPPDGAGAAAGAAPGARPVRAALAWIFAALAAALAAILAVSVARRRSEGRAEG